MKIFPNLTALLLIASCTPAFAEKIVIDEVPEEVKEVAIISEDGEYTFVYSRNHLQCPGTYISSGKLVIETTRALGVRWNDGKKYVVPAIPAAGNYIVILSENLETEQADVLSRRKLFHTSSREVFKRNKSNKEKLTCADQ